MIPQEAGREGVSVADVLSRAADLIEPEGAWTQGWSARTQGGEPSYALSAEATCWCMGGAIVRAAGQDKGGLVQAAYDQVGEVSGGVVAFNDAFTRTQAEVVAKLREAAAVAREQGL